MGVLLHLVQQGGDSVGLWISLPTDGGLRLSRPGCLVLRQYGHHCLFTVDCFIVVLSDG